MAARSIHAFVSSSITGPGIDDRSKNAPPSHVPRLSIYRESPNNKLPSISITSERANPNNAYRITSRRPYTDPKLQPLRAGNHGYIGPQRRSFALVGRPSMSSCRNDGDMVAKQQPKSPPCSSLFLTGWRFSPAGCHLPTYAG